MSATLRQLMCRHPQRRFTVQSYYIFFIPASTYTKKMPFMSENINGNLNK